MNEDLKLIIQKNVGGQSIKIEQYEDASFLLTTTQQEDEVGEPYQHLGENVVGSYHLKGEEVTYEAANVKELKEFLVVSGLSGEDAESTVIAVAEKC